MYFEVFIEIRFRKHPSQSSLWFNGAEYFLSSKYLFLRVCVLYVLYDAWVSTDLSLSIKTTTTLYDHLLNKVTVVELDSRPVVDTFNDYTNTAIGRLLSKWNNNPTGTSPIHA